jgi:hypothetical protein
LIPLPVLEIGTSDGENPMDRNVDVYVCEPEVGINRRREAVCIEFEVMNPATQEGSGRSHTVLMPVQDAMQLLRTLQHIQKKFALPDGAIEPAMIEMTQKTN